MLLSRLHNGRPVGHIFGSLVGQPHVAVEETPTLILGGNGSELPFLHTGVAGPVTPIRGPPSRHVTLAQHGLIHACPRPRRVGCHVVQCLTERRIPVSPIESSLPPVVSGLRLDALQFSLRRALLRCGDPLLNAGKFLRQTSTFNVQTLSESYVLRGHRNATTGNEVIDLCEASLNLSDAGRLSVGSPRNLHAPLTIDPLDLFTHGHADTGLVGNHVGGILFLRPQPRHFTHNA